MVAILAEEEYYWCAPDIKPRAEKLEQETSEWPTFPVNGLSFSEHAPNLTVTYTYSF